MSYPGVITELTLDAEGEITYEIPKGSWWLAVQAVDGDVSMRFDAEGDPWTIYGKGVALSLPAKTGGGSTLYFDGTVGDKVQILLTTGPQS
jgi:hypothetical protein